MLVIKKHFNFEEFESSLSLAKTERELRLPTQFSHSGYWGIDVALIQLLMTWARTHQDREIKTYIEDNDLEGRSRQLSDWGKRLFGIAALYLTKTLVTAQGTPIAREEYARHCSEVLKAMDQANIHSVKEINDTYPRSGDKVAAQFVCLHGSRFEFLGSLYHSPSRDELLNRRDFSYLVRTALAKNNRFANYLQLNPRVWDDLTYLIYELFQNTNDHAYENFDGSLFASNLRAFSIKSHSGMLRHEHLGKMETGNAQFNEYLDSCRQLFNKPGIETHHFLEVSMVDGGLGYAQKLLGKPLSQLTLEQEKQATLDCFNQGVSSKTAQSRGEGLDHVWRALCELKGFIRLRTGRLCLFQTFHNRTAEEYRNLSAWTESALEAVSGTAVTIIIPCVFNDESPA
jgi:hypothetical protein